MKEEEELFELLVETPAENRGEVLDRLCNDQPEQRARLERLLAAHNQTNPLDSPIASSEMQRLAQHIELEDLPRDQTVDYRKDHEGRSYGPYTLERLLGEGGMGAVWVAKQSRPVKRRVALKLIKSGMDSREVLARFEHERQALAVMDHPSIARVLDGGLTEDGRPFFAMELVNGLPLTKFCDEAKLSTEERLDIFVQICSAVQHAHQKGIIHRDLKPANILVTLIDGKPVPKVIDFGVSKALSGNLTDHTLTTQFGAVIGTFEYMAPEQAGYSGADVDTRADIYALGVILYELLTGLKPFDSQRIRKAAVDEVLRIIREEEPSKPSTRLSSAESRPSLAALRRLDPTSLARKIRGDLDWIALKCLEKDRSRRYETANQLALEVKRYLADEPILAGPPSTAYRLRKFLRRNRGQVAVATIVLAALVIGLAASLWQMNRAIIAERSAIKARDEESQQRKKADELRIKAEKNEQKAIEGGRRAQEALDAITDSAISSLFSQKSKLTEKERQFFKRLLSLYDGLWKFEGDDRESISRRMQGYWRVTQMQANLGAYDDSVEALDRMQKVFADLEKQNDPESGYFRVLALRNASNLCFSAGRKDDGKRFLDEGEAVARRLVNTHPNDNDLVVSELLFAYDKLRHFPRQDLKEQADALGRIVTKAQSLIQVAKDPGSPATLMLDCLGFQFDSLLAANANEEALATVNKVLEYVDRNPRDRAALPRAYLLNKRGYTLWHRGNLLGKLGRDSEAIDDYQKGLSVMSEREAVGLVRYQDWDILWNGSRMLRCGLADAYERQKKYREATEQRRLALADVDRWAEFVVDQKPVIQVKALLQNDLARSLRLGGGSQLEAIDALLRCAEYREAHFKQLDNPNLFRGSAAAYREAAAQYMMELGRIDDAIEQRRQAIVTRQLVINDNPQAALSSSMRNELGWCHLDLGLILFAKKETALAIEEIERGIKTFNEELAREASDVDSLKFKVMANDGIAHAHHRVADFWWKNGELAKARDRYDLAIEWDTKSHHAHPEDYKVLEMLASAWHNRGQCKLGLGDFSAAVIDFKTAIDLLKNAPVHEQHTISVADQWTNDLDVTAEKRRVAGHPAEALELFRDVLAIRLGLSAKFPDSSTYRQRVVWSIHNVCIGSIDAGKMEDALAAAKELGVACRDFGKHHGDKAEEVLNVSDTAYKAGKRLLNAGQTTAASELYAARLAIRVDLAERFPEKPSYLDAIMYAHYDLFKASWVEGNRDAALASMRKSIDAAVARRTKFPALRESHAKYDECVNLFCSTLRESKEYGLILELVREYRKQISKDHPTDLEWTSSVLIYGGRAALATFQFAEAEAILRDALKSFEATIPNDWQVSNCRCYVGEAMIGQGKFDEANAMLVEGYEGLFTRRASIPAGNTSRVRIVAEMLRALAETRKSPEDVERWTRELKKLDGESPSAK